jgi:prepilin-type N-terminal cleavage/methylation domain-containing protein
MFNKQKRGFTVAEMLVAIIILGVGMLALAGLMATVMGRHTRATVVQEMTTLAESKLEELRALSIIKSADTAQVTLGGSLTANVTKHNDTIASPVGRTYYRRWAVAIHPSGTRKVDMRIEMTQTHDRHKVGAMDFSTLMLVVR